MVTDVLIALKLDALAVNVDQLETSGSWSICASPTSPV